MSSKQEKAYNKAKHFRFARTHYVRPCLRRYGNIDILKYITILLTTMMCSMATYSSEQKCVDSINVQNDKNIVEHCSSYLSQDANVDFAYGLSLIKTSFTKNQIQTLMLLGVHYASKEHIEILTTATSLMLAAAEKGVIPAQMQYGTYKSILAFTNSPPNRNKESIDVRNFWYKKSADSGDVNAMYIYAIGGIDTVANKVTIPMQAKYLEKAAANGHKDAEKLLFKLKAQNKSLKTDI
jgi:TPR repeat protein